MKKYNVFDILYGKASNDYIPNFSILKTLAEKLFSKLNWKHQKILRQTVELEKYQYHVHTKGAYVIEIDAKSTLFVAPQVWKFFQHFSEEFWWEILQEKIKKFMFFGLNTSAETWKTP